MSKGKFIVIEGGEGTGKTTHTRMLSEVLTLSGIKHITTKEPGGSEVCSKIRAILLDPKGKVVPIAELLLYMADRIQHLEEVVKPALDSGIHVLCDRYKYSTKAYQAAARGLHGEYNGLMSVLDFLEPDLAILLDCPVSESLPRAKARGNDTRFELESIGFHEKVREGFLDQFKSSTGKDQNHLKIVDISGRSTMHVFQEIEAMVDNLLNGERKWKEI